MSGQRSGDLRELRGTAPEPGACHVKINRVQCTQPAVSTWEGGCVHEHVTTDIGLCAEHRELAARPFDCLLCRDHTCMVQLRGGEARWPRGLTG